MFDFQYLNLLSESYPNILTASEELIRLLTINARPKGTEYFFSDLHGEHEAFLHQLKSGSGVIKTHIDEIFFKTMTESDRAALAGLIYEPAAVVRKRNAEPGFDEWFRITVSALVEVCRDFAGKYTLSDVRKKSPKHFENVTDELLHFNGAAADMHFEKIVNSILKSGTACEFLCGFCEMIRNLAVDRLHIIGDIFDRGPHADYIIDELMKYDRIDIQWGNHDIAWMGASLGNLTCIASVIRIGIGYNNFDCLEVGYGINLRPLSMFASETYKDDDCLDFYPHVLDESKFDRVSVSLAAKMHKAITIIQLKLEGQLYERHPEYGMSDRNLLSRIDFDENTVVIEGREYKLKNIQLPTVDKNNPLKLTESEQNLMYTLAASFVYSEKLRKHIKFLYEKGSMYNICNNNLMYHGCVPMTEDGEFETVTFNGQSYSGRRYFDYINNTVRDAFFAPVEINSAVTDFFWFLWCSRKSPIFGKDKMTVLEKYFVEDKRASKEKMNPYYKLIEKKSVCRKILDEFGLGENAHIINGHVPVKEGENPVKGDGLLFMIDGGISKAYQPKTGIGGYTFIYSSRYMALAKHSTDEWKDNKEIPTICEVERFPKRMLVEDTDKGKSINEEINALESLLEAYRKGQIKERR